MWTIWRKILKNTKAANYCNYNKFDGLFKYIYWINK